MNEGVWSEHSTKPHFEATTGAAALQALKVELLHRKPAAKGTS